MKTPEPPLFPGRKREGKKKGGGEILEVGKGGMWQNGSESRIRNRDEIRVNRMDGMDKGVAYREIRQSSMSYG